MTHESPVAVEQRTQAWLDASLTAGFAEAPEHPLAYGPDGRPRHISRVHFGRLRRKLRVFAWLDRFDFASFLDVASGWEHYPHLVRQRYGSDAAYYSDMVHRVNLPTDGPLFGKLDHAVTLRLPRLPYRDRAFDVVLCSEVLEHLVRPVESLAELWRITGKYLIITSLEALSMSRWQRWLAQLRVDVRQPHIERNFFLRSELQALLGDTVAFENLQYVPDEPVHPFASTAEQDAALTRLNDVDALVEALCRAVSHPDAGPGGLGLLIVKARAGALVRQASPGGAPALARWLVDQAAREEQAVQDALAVAGAWQRGLLQYPRAQADALRTRPVAPALLELLQCPDCRGTLQPVGSGLRCTACRSSFASECGVPILYATGAFDEASQRAEALASLCGEDQARRRSVQRSMRRLRRNEQPPGAARRLLWRLTNSNQTADEHS